MPSGGGDSAASQIGSGCATLAGGAPWPAGRDRRGVRHRGHHSQFELSGSGAARRAGVGGLERRGRWSLWRAARYRDRGNQAHPSIFKALGVAGFGRNRVVRVPVDGQGRMRADVFPAITGPTIACLQAGNVNSGAFDPAETIIPRAKDAGAWVHVDGAFGLWAAASPRYAHLVAGYADADSWATDAHKYLNAPYDSGLAFVREPEHLRAAMAVSAAYLPASSIRDLSDYTPEMGRRARGIEVWAALRSLGRTGVAELVERTCELARRFATGLQEAGYQILNEVVLNQVLVSFGDAAMTTRILAALQKEGTCWVGVPSGKARPQFGSASPHGVRRTPT